MFPSSILAGSTIPVLEQVANFTEARHAVLAGNVANLDTPGYKVRDLSPERFNQQLQAAIQTRDQRRSSVTAPNGGYAAQDGLKHVHENLKSILYHDDSNDSIEHQVTQIAKNQARHNMAIAIMTSQFRLLEAAISERA